MKQILSVLSFGLLVACGPIYQTTYEMVPPPTQTGKMCANNCLLAKQNCDQQCQIQRQQCEEIERLRAQSDYLSYLNQQNREGLPATKDQSDFYRGSYSCQRDSCEESCGSNYRICHTNCGGQVIPHTACTAFCE